MKLTSSVKFSTKTMENVQNVSEDTTLCIPENAFNKLNVNQDKFWSTTTVKMLAQHVETMTEPQESVLTVSVKNMNFIMDFVFQ